MTSSLRYRVISAAGYGALAMSAAMLGGDNGLEGMRHTPYRDVVGVLSVCYGHTGKDIKAGRYYTDQECRALLNEDLEKVAAQIDPVIKVKIPDTTRAALYSFTYSAGVDAFKSSTLLEKLNAGDRKGVCDELRRWVYADGKKWKGLMNRRKIEREVCLWEKS